MRTRLQEWANYFAAVGLALWAAAGILFLLGNQPNERLMALAALGVLFVALYVYARPSEVREAVTSRGVRYGSNALVISIAFIGIIALLSFLGSRYHWRFDVTANKSFTLSPLTIETLKGLKEPVQAIAFYSGFSDPQSRQGVEDRLREYVGYTDKLTYRFVDPQAEPQVAREYKVQFDGTLVFERGKRRENALGSDEQALTNAIHKVSQYTHPVIYFTTGHGEHTLSDSGTSGFSGMKQFLETVNYKVDSINLKTITDTLPSDLTLLVIAGPRQPFDPQEVVRVRDYLNNQSGRVLIMLDPQADSGLDNLLIGWGVQASNDMVIDPKFGLFGRVQIPTITEYKSHDVTKDLTGLDTIFPGVRSLAPTDAPAPNRTPTALFASSDLSWGETDFEALKNQKLQLDAGKDAKGPLDLAFAVEATGGDKAARLVVIGNSTFVMNGTLNDLFSAGRDNSGNVLLFRNAVNWLAGQEDQLAIPPKQSDNRSVFLTAEQANFVLWSSFLLIQAAILVVGALVWWRRR